MGQITKAHLEYKVRRLNKMTGNPVEPWGSKDGKLRANIGNYHLCWAYGGVDLHQMDNQGGGVNTPLSCGCTTKRDLANRIDAFISGVREGQDGS